MQEKYIRKEDNKEGFFDYYGDTFVSEGYFSDSNSPISTDGGSDLEQELADPVSSPHIVLAHNATPSLATNSSAKISVKDLLPILPPLVSLLSSISTMYSDQDVIRQILTAMGYESDVIEQVLAALDEDRASTGENSETLSQQIIDAMAKVALWGLPSLTIIANTILRYFSFLKIEDLSKVLKDRRLASAISVLVLYLFFAVPTDIADTTNNVALSETLKEEWSPWAIYSESVLSFIFLLPINLIGIWKLHERVNLAYEGYSTGDDRKLLSRRLEAIFYELKDLSRDEQVGMLTTWLSDCPDADLNINQPLLESYSDIKGFSESKLKALAEYICKNENLRDGSSWGSAITMKMTILFSLVAGAATMRSPFLFYTGLCSLPDPVAWTASIISGLTKSAFYMGSYESLIWFLMHYDRLFGSAPILYGLGGVAMVVSAAGFVEVAERALAAIFKKAAEDPSWWYYLLESIISLAGVVANTNGAASLAVLKMEEKRQSELTESGDGQPDIATAFKERASEVLKPKPVPALVDEERSALTREQSRCASSTTSSRYSTFTFFGSTERSTRDYGLLGPLTRMAKLTMGFNF